MNKEREGKGKTPEEDTGKKNPRFDLVCGLSSFPCNAFLLEISPPSLNQTDRISKGGGREKADLDWIEEEGKGRLMLPTVSKGRTPTAVRPSPMFPQYLRRIVKWQQMDIEYTFWQMLHLCTSPKVVYQHTKYHKQTKNQWARDDPAFVVILCLFLVVATSAYCAAYGESLAHAVSTVVSVVVFHFLIAGIILATCCWFLTNAYLREEAPNSHVVEQRVEWLYAFDVHCNSFFPMFIMLYVIQYFVSPILVAHGFFPVLLSNLLFMVAMSYYHYLNFLGYDVLPFLDKTTFFLYPIGLVIVLSPLMILSGFNPTRYIMNLYFS